MWVTAFNFQEWEGAAVFKASHVCVVIFRDLNWTRVLALKEGVVRCMFRITYVWRFGNSNGSAIFPFCLTPAELFLDVMAQLTGELTK